MFGFRLMSLVGIQLTPKFNYVLFEQFRIIGNHKHVKICPRHFSLFPGTKRKSSFASSFFTMVH